VQLLDGRLLLAATDLNEFLLCRHLVSLNLALRTQRGLSQSAMAKLLRSSQSRVAKMEPGDATVSLDLLVRSLLAIGASPKDIGRAIGRDAA
jgi:transcriptional regulator with XRE-family HTH domain